jgi:hypothetical protein
MRDRRFLLPSLLLLGLFTSTARADDKVREIHPERLQEHVRILASEEYGGRSGAGARMAEEYVRKAFEEAGLAVTVTDAPGHQGEPCRNVIGVLQAQKEPASEHIIVSAHYDHLGVRNGKMYPGAGDNAAGVAVMIEIARNLTAEGARDVLFIAFDQEEWGLIGSRLYVKQPLRPLSECVAFITMDILGRSLADVLTEELFCMGLERSDTLFPAMCSIEEPEGLRLAFVGEEVAASRSDFAPFRDEEVPFIFFTGGVYGDYHRPTDTAERLDTAKLLLEARLLLDATRAVLAAPRPRFLAEPVCRVEEAASLDRILGRLLEKKDLIGLGQAEATMGQMFRGSLQQIVSAGKMLPAQRKAIIMSCQVLTRALEGQR